MRNPLKQGLKHPSNDMFPMMSLCRNAKSTKTRIETLYRSTAHGAFDCRNAKSTKTRIETRVPLPYPSLVGKSQCEIH